MKKLETSHDFWVHAFGGCAFASIALQLLLFGPSLLAQSGGDPPVGGDDICCGDSDNACCKCRCEWYSNIDLSGALECRHGPENDPQCHGEGSLPCCEDQSGGCTEPPGSSIECRCKGCHEGLIGAALDPAIPPCEGEVIRLICHCGISGSVPSEDGSCAISEDAAGPNEQFVRQKYYEAVLIDRANHYPYQGQPEMQTHKFCPADDESQHAYTYCRTNSCKRKPGAEVIEIYGDTKPICLDD